MRYVDDRDYRRQEYPEDRMDVFRRDRQGPFIWVDRRDRLWTYDRDNMFVECDEQGYPLYQEPLNVPRNEVDDRYEKPAIRSSRGVGRVSSRQRDDRDSIRSETKNRRNKIKKNRISQSREEHSSVKEESVVNKLHGLKPEKGSELVPFIKSGQILDIVPNGKLFRFILKEK